MSEYMDMNQIEMKKVPVVVLRGQIAFPNIPLTMELASDKSIASCEWADENNSPLFLIAQSDIFESGSEALLRVGTLAFVSSIVHLPNGRVRVQVEGFARAEARSYVSRDGLLLADVCSTEYLDAFDDVLITHRQRLLDLFDDFCSFVPRMPKERIDAVKEIEDPVLLMDMIVNELPFEFEDKQRILDVFHPLERYEVLLALMSTQLERLRVEQELHGKTQRNIDMNQREYYLKEELKTIQEELGYDEGDDEIEEYITRIKEVIDDEKSREKLIREANKLAKIPFGASEGTVIHGYLDTVLEYPWKKMTEDELDIERARKILNDDHDGIDKVKERVLEYLAVKKLSGGKSAQILCLVGAPGVGKTSVAQSIARAMGRKFVRISLGGVRDEAEIRGHRRTYLGSMPGRIIAAITEAGVENPLILLDEIDKMTSDLHGDPSSALLEVLDPEQNKNFRDHFMEIPTDLSKCVFIATANSLGTVQRPLIDRMEVIEMSSYTREEKLSIAKHHLVKKQLAQNGIPASKLRISDKALLALIDDYTAEAGVRSLERRIASICRKAAVRILEDPDVRISVTGTNLAEFLPDPVIPAKKVGGAGRVGVVNGMAYTELGGDLLEVEAISMPGSGKIILTGSLGDVMKESANISLSYIRSISAALDIRESFYRDTDIHVHFPEGAVPKDGPSAGVTVTTAIVSELTGCAVRSDVAMTGEISLKGKVLPIGGLREKTMAAYKAGVKTILVPKDNAASMVEVDAKIKDKIEFIFCDTVADVLRCAMDFDGIESADPVRRKRMAALKNFVRG